MKRGLSVVVLFVFLFQGVYTAIAATRGTPEYEKLKEYKKAQKEKKSSSSPGPKGFWQKEAERSGFAGTAAMFGNAAAAAVPLDKPNSRKDSK